MGAKPEYPDFGNYAALAEDWLELGSYSTVHDSANSRRAVLRRSVFLPPILPRCSISAWEDFNRLGTVRKDARLRMEQFDDNGEHLFYISLQWLDPDLVTLESDLTDPPRHPFRPEQASWEGAKQLYVYLARPMLSVVSVTRAGSRHATLYNKS